MVCATGEPDWSGVTLETFNQTLLYDRRLCNSCICPIELDGLHLGVMGYFPNLAGNAVLAAVFGLCLLPQLYLGIRHKTWGFMAGMTGGILLEVLGYVGRILMRDNMFTDTYFIMSLVCLTIGPAFLAAAIYLTLSRLIVIYAADRARFRPQVYTYIFIGCDVVALVLQAAGGAIASISPPTSPDLQRGIDTMIAGVAWQVVVLALFAALSGDFWMRVRARKGVQPALNPAFVELRGKRAFAPSFIIGVGLAGLAIFVRSVFRCAELSEGFSGPLANDEVTFMVLEGAMIASACILLTVFHPGLIVGKEEWSAASWKAEKGSRGDVEKTSWSASRSASSERE